MIRVFLNIRWVGVLLCMRQGGQFQLATQTFVNVTPSLVHFEMQSLR